MGLFGKRSSRWDGIDFMALKPLQKVACRPDEQNGNTVLLVPRFQSGLLGRWLQPRLRENKKYIRVPLEKRGTFLWSKCDGQHTVGALAQGYRQEFPDDIDQAENRVCQYLYQLENNAFIEFIGL